MSRADKLFKYFTIPVIFAFLSFVAIGGSIYNLHVSVNEPSSSTNAETVENLRETIDRDEEEAQRVRTEERLIIFRLNRIESRLLRLELETRATKN